MSRVLIIDDDSDTCELLSIILTEAKHDVFFATNGRAGLDLVRSTRPEVVVVDIFMPEMDGLTVISKVRPIDPYVLQKTIARLVAAA